MSVTSGSVTLQKDAQNLVKLKILYTDYNLIKKRKAKTVFHTKMFFPH